LNSVDVVVGVGSWLEKIGEREKLKNKKRSVNELIFDYRNENGRRRSKRGKEGREDVRT
jgi:hypothetical protein